MRLRPLLYQTRRSEFPYSLCARACMHHSSALFVGFLRLFARLPLLLGIFFCLHFFTSSLSFLFCLKLHLLSLELSRCPLGIFLSSRPRSGVVSLYIIGYG